MVLASVYAPTSSVKYDFPPYKGSRRRLIIASVPRCGSHFLGHTLYSTKKLGLPLEYLKKGHWQAWENRARSTQPAVVLNKLYERRTASTGVFSCKLHWSQVSQLNDMGLIDLFDGAVVVMVQRADLLGQAISWSIAMQTESWISTQRRVRAPIFMRDAIDRNMHDILEQEGTWKLFLMGMNIVPLVVNYEAFEHDPKYWTRQIAELLGVKLPRTLDLKPGINQQRTAESERWRKAYLNSIPYVASRALSRIKVERPKPAPAEPSGARDVEPAAGAPAKQGLPKPAHQGVQEIRQHHERPGDRHHGEPAAAPQDGGENTHTRQTTKTTKTTKTKARGLAKSATG